MFLQNNCSISLEKNCKSDNILIGDFMVISGIVEEIIFRNPENGYSVVIIDYNNEMVTAVGKFPQISEGENVELVGKFIKHNKYGEQFKADSVKITPPNTEEGIVKFLSSGLIRGVGPITAQNIVKHFGKATLDIIDYNPQRLLEVKGISKNKLEDILESFAGVRQMQETIMMMQKYNISTNLALKIYNTYQDRTPIILQTNPYKLVEDVTGVGFATADRIAQSMGIAADSEYRIRAGLQHIVKDNSEKTGNTYIPKENLLEELDALLKIECDKNVVEKILSDMCMALILKEIEVENAKAIMTYSLYNTERKVATLLNNLMCKKLPNIDVSKDIEMFETFSHIKMHDTQKDAVSLAVNNGVCVITGGPGTGKTTIIKCILNIFKGMGKNVRLLAPTGRAGKRLAESTGEDASTIHRALGVDYNNPNMFFYNAGNKMPFDVVIVDEVSMVDVQLAYYLLRALKNECRLILVGDKDQLPSVGAGNVLSDILSSGCIPYVALTHIYRQDNKSLIVTNAHLINNGKMPILDNKSTDFFYEEFSDGQDMLNSIVGLVTKRIPAYLHCDTSKIQVLAPMKAGVCGVENINKHLQNTINPASITKNEVSFGDNVCFREGDRVMQTSNNYEREWMKGTERGTGVFNGDIGIISHIDRATKETTIEFEDGRTARYLVTDLSEIVLSYAITIHKSQGSEFDVVIIPVVSGAYMLLTRNLLYTAVTRAKKMVVLVGNKKNIGAMVHNNYTQVRYSMLKQFLIEAKDTYTKIFTQDNNFGDSKYASHIVSIEENDEN